MWLWETASKHFCMDWPYYLCPEADFILLGKMQSCEYTLFDIINQMYNWGIIDSKV